MNVKHVDLFLAHRKRYKSNKNSYVMNSNKSTYICITNKLLPLYYNWGG